MKLDFIVECGRCRRRVTTLFKEVSITSQTRISMGYWKDFPCPSCERVCWDLIVQPSDPTVIVDDVSRETLKGEEPHA